MTKQPLKKGVVGPAVFQLLSHNRHLPECAGKIRLLNAKGEFETLPHHSPPEKE